MFVSHAALVPEKRPMIEGSLELPTTFFSLTAQEQMAYNAFRVQHADLEGKLRGLSRAEITEREHALQRSFIAFVQPHLDRAGLKSALCFAGYGEQRVLLTTPAYALFVNNDPFFATAEVTYWFSTAEDTISCTTHLVYTPRGPVATTPQRPVVHALLQRVFSEKEQEDHKEPYITFRGDFIYFASAELACSLMLTIREILTEIGPSTLRDLNILHQEYLSHKSFTHDAVPSLQEKIFQEAYQRRLELELLRTGYIAQRLQTV